MTQETYVYPGSFSPPTYGHVDIVIRALKIFRQVVVVCSKNPDKKNDFTPEECVRMWQSYNLPRQVEVVTLSEFVAKKIPSHNIVMIRGIRNEKDLEYEQKIAFYNHQTYGVDKYFYLYSKCHLRNISSTHARQAAHNLNLQTLSRLISPLVVTMLLEKELDKKIYMAVGKPGSGKSTILSRLTETNKDVIYINTDRYNELLKPKLLKHFGQNADLIDLAVNRETELSAYLGDYWLYLLQQDLLKTKMNQTAKAVVVEIAFGLQDKKDTFRFLGARIIYFGCRSQATNIKRNNNRDTLNLSPFISLIPGLRESKVVSRRHCLDLKVVWCEGKIESIKKQVLQILFSR